MPSPGPERAHPTLQETPIPTRSHASTTLPLCTLALQPMPTGTGGALVRRISGLPDLVGLPTECADVF